jgi:hypothetical protein
MVPLKPSHIVKSLAGHDKDRIYHVLSLDNGYAALTDGKVRHLANPKRKQLKHLSFQSESDSPAARAISDGGAVSNRDIIKSLAAFKAGQVFDEGGK